MVTAFVFEDGCRSDHVNERFARLSPGQSIEVGAKASVCSLDVSAPFMVIGCDRNKLNVMFFAEFQKFTFVVFSVTSNRQRYFMFKQLNSFQHFDLVTKTHGAERFSLRPT